MKLFNFNEHLPNIEDFYENRHFSNISKESLDNTYEKIEKYINSGDLYREMFYLKDQYIMPRLKDYDFGEWEKVRWFVKLKDVQDYLVKMYKSVVFGYDNQNTYDSMEKNEKKKLTRMENWSIRSQT